MTKEEAKNRITVIDELFENASGWRSWMVSAANKRERLATQFGFKQKGQARLTGDGRTD